MTTLISCCMVQNIIIHNNIEAKLCGIYTGQVFISNLGKQVLKSDCERSNALGRRLTSFVTGRRMCELSNLILTTYYELNKKKPRMDIGELY